MKRFTTIIFCISLLFTACGQNQSKEKSSGKADETSDTILETDDLKKAKTCDEFIDQYAEWMDDYIALLEKYMKDPTDAMLSQEYMTVAQEGMTWMTQWNSKLYSCASKEKYQKRFDEISEKAEKKLEELGIE